MNLNWTTRHKIASAAALLLPIVIWNLLNAGVREIDLAHQAVNFPVVDARPAPGDWPWWHGATQSNSVPQASPPIHWSPSNGAGWIVPVSGRGRTSMALWGDQLFLPVVDANRAAIDLLCLNPSTGRLLWQTELHRGDLHSPTPRSSSASPGPACDGQHVFMVCPSNGSLNVSAVDLTGRIAWQKEAGPYFSNWGYSSSPAIYKSLVIVAADNKGASLNRLGGTSYLAALHRTSGEIVWRVYRPEADSFGTPVIAHVAGRDQLLLAGRDMVCSYDPQTGKLIWSCQWSADRVSNSLAFDDERVYATTRTHKPELLCIRADGTGDVTKTHIAWRSTRLASDLPSPVVYDGRLYVQSDDGTLACVDADNGKPIWKRQLPGTITSTPLIAGDHLYCCNDEGKVFVIRLEGKGDLVAEIPLGSGIFTSPIASHNRLYLRTLAGVHCVHPSGDSPVAIQPDSSRRRL